MGNKPGLLLFSYHGLYFEGEERAIEGRYLRRRSCFYNP
jgi:hypothetical protein